MEQNSSNLLQQGFYWTQRPYLCLVEVEGGTLSLACMSCPWYFGTCPSLFGHVAKHPYLPWGHWWCSRWKDELGGSWWWCRCVHVHVESSPPGLASSKMAETKEQHPITQETNKYKKETFSEDSGFKVHQTRLSQILFSLRGCHPVQRMMSMVTDCLFLHLSSLLSGSTQDLV